MTAITQEGGNQFACFDLPPNSTEEASTTIIVYSWGYIVTLTKNNRKAEKYKERNQHKNVEMSEEKKTQKRTTAERLETDKKTKTTDTKIKR